MALRKRHRWSWLWLMAALPVVAADNTSLEPVRAQLRVKNFSQAAALLRPLAEAGRADAELLLANLYYYGLGTQIDTDQGHRWLERAAVHGSADAMYQLAATLAAQSAPDLDAIRRWLQRAAAAGHAPADEALQQGILPQQFQPALLQDVAARRTAFFLAASRDDIALLKTFTDPTLLQTRDEFGRSALSWAARHGAIHAVDWLVQSGADANGADSFGVTPLMLAAGAGRIAAVQSLLRAHASAVAQDRSGNNALMYATDRKHTECVMALLGVSDIRQRNRQGWSALDWAIHSDDAALTAKLRELGLQSSRPAPTITGKPAIPLQRAVNGDLYHGWPDVLVAGTRNGTELFEEVLQTNSQALRGHEGRALLVAVQAGNAQLIQALLASGVGVDATQRESPLSWAVRHDKPDLVHLLLTGGVKPETHGTDEPLPLLDAARLSTPGASTIMDALLRAGARTDAVDARGRSALILAVQMQQTAVVIRLLESGADSNLADRNGRTALMYAVQNGLTDITRALLAGQAGVDRRDRDGNTALMLAAAAGKIEVVKLLLAAGAGAQGNSAGVTALMLAAAAGKEELVRTLLNSGANIDTQDRHGDTALIHATRRGQTAVVRSLLEAGADTGLRNDDRTSALDIAERLAFKDVTAILDKRS